MASTHVSLPLSATSRFSDSISWLQSPASQSAVPEAAGFSFASQHLRISVPSFIPLGPRAQKKSLEPYAHLGEAVKRSSRTGFFLLSHVQFWRPSLSHRESAAVIVDPATNHVSSCTSPWWKAQDLVRLSFGQSKPQVQGPTAVSLPAVFSRLG